MRGQISSSSDSNRVAVQVLSRVGCPTLESLTVLRCVAWGERGIGPLDKRILGYHLRFCRRFFDRDTRLCINRPSRAVGVRSAASRPAQRFEADRPSGPERYRPVGPSVAGPVGPERRTYQNSHIVQCGLWPGQSVSPHPSCSSRLTPYHCFSLGFPFGVPVWSRLCCQPEFDSRILEAVLTPNSSLRTSRTPDRSHTASSSTWPRGLELPPPGGMGGSASCVSLYGGYSIRSGR
jgi:hypothetical protein